MYEYELCFEICLEYHSSSLTSREKWFVSVASPSLSFQNNSSEDENKKKIMSTPRRAPSPRQSLNYVIRSFIKRVD